MLRLGRVFRLGGAVKQLQQRCQATVATTACGDAVPDRCDVLIIGGGGMGASSAYWLKRKTQKEKLSVLVVERDACVS